MNEGEVAKVLHSVAELIQRGDGRLSLTDAIALVRALGAEARLLCGMERVHAERFVVLGTSDPGPMVALRRAGERSGELLERRQEVGADQWEYPAVDEALQPTLWLELTGSDPERVQHLRLAPHEFALLDAHGWREDWADLLAEPRVWVAILLTGLARAFSLDEVALDDADLTSTESRREAAHRAGELLQRKLREIDTSARR